MDISNLATEEIMNIYAGILDELNRRNIVRTYNNPVGDYAEWLVANKLHFELQTNSQKGYDAVNSDNGVRYQIKSRWERGKPTSQSRELNVIRNYDDNQFDILVVVIFDDKFGVRAAYEVPHELVGKYGKWSKHQNGYVFTALGAVLEDGKVKNITEFLR